MSELTTGWKQPPQDARIYRVTELMEPLNAALNRAGGRELPLPCAICGSTETCKVEIDWQKSTALWTCRNPQPMEF